MAQEQEMAAQGAAAIRQTSRGLCQVIVERAAVHTNDMGLIDADSPWKYCDSELEKAKVQRRIARFLIPLLRANSISSVLEVGANNGQGTLMLQVQA